MLKRLESIVFLFILVLFTLLGCSGSEEADVPPQVRTPKLIGLTEPLAYSKGQKISPLVINNTGDPVISCTITPDLPVGLGIATDSGNCQITGTPTVALAEIAFTVTGTDAEGETDTATVSIAVNEVNNGIPSENKPPSLISLTEPLAYFKDQAITPLVINNTGDPVVECTVDSNLPNGLEIVTDSGNCRITGTPTVTLVETEFTITGTDTEGETDTATVSIVVHEKRPPSLANVTTKQAYFKDQAITPLVINNTGDPVVECTVDSNLPNGLEIVTDSGNCRIAGTPTVTLVETEFTITGVDTEGETDTATVSIVVHEKRPPSLANATTTQAYFKGQAIIPLVIANTGDPVVECTVDSSLPNGLTIAVNSGNCRITGTPTVTLVETEFTITGVDAEGETDTATVSIVVHEKRPPSLANVATTQAYFKGQAIIPLVIANTGDPVVECAVDSSLPNGLTIAVNSGSCRITGTPTVTSAETEFTITGTDAEGETDTATVSIVVHEKRPPSLASIAATQAYFKGQTIAPLVINNTGDPVVGCTINSDLPDGLTIAVNSGSCRIMGTPTVILVETEFTITGTDAEGETDAATISILISDPTLSKLSTSILSPTFPLATASDTTIIIQTNQSSSIGIHRGLNCSGEQVVSKNVSDIASNVEIILPAANLKKDNADTDFSNFFTLCQEDKERSNAMAKITSFMVHSLLIYKSVDAGSFQIGDIWSRVFMRERNEHNTDRFVSSAIFSYSHLVQRLFGTYTTDSFTVPEIDFAPFPEHFKRLGRSVIYSQIDSITNGTSFYVGKNTYKSKTYYIMATNHHVACEIPPGVCRFKPIDTGTVYRAFLSFPLYEYDFNRMSFIGTWPEIEFALYVFELPNTYSEEKKRSIDANLSNSGLEFDFTSDIYPGQELVNVGYGEKFNPPLNTNPERGESLTFGFDKDCKVFSPRNDFPARLLDPDDVLPEDYKIFSFAHGCDVSGGDSGGPVMDRKTGKIVGVVWSRAPNTDSNTKSSEYIHTHYMNKKDAFDNLPLAVPALKIKTHLEDWFTKNDATLGEIQKRLLRKFLNKELE